MTTPTPTNEQSTSTPNPAQDLGELPFAEFERVRRGGEMPAKEAKSAPAEETREEQKSAEDSETSEAEAKESELEASDDESEDSKEDESKEEDKPKSKKSGIQKRVDKLRAREAKALQELEYWKQQALSGKSDSKPNPEKVEAQKSAAPQDGKPNPEHFDTYAEYTEALTDWKVDQKMKAQSEQAEQAKHQAEQEKLINSHRERVKAFAEKTKDWEEALESVDDVPMSATVQQILVSSENGPELMYELAKNRAEFERICKLGPIAAAREIGKLETRITSKASEEKKPEPKKLTNAPKPIEPVGKSAATVRKSIDDPELSFAEYERMRREQMKRKR